MSEKHPVIPHQTTVIIPTYNRAVLLSETVESVLGQSLPVSEVLVVNDGSGDNTSAVVTAFGDAVTLIDKENSGKADSLNLALARAACDRIWIVDDDDLLRRDAHKILAGLLDAQPDAGFAYGRHERFTRKQPGGPKTCIGTGYWGDDDPDRFFVSTLEDFFVHQPGMIVHKALYDAVGSFDPLLPASEDYDMLIRLARAGRSVSTSEIVFYQRVHDGARGRSGEEYRASERETKWIQADQMIFERVRETLSLEEYIPVSRRADYREDGLKQRAALLQRATVFARRKMWDIVLEDLSAATAILPNALLSPEETATLRRATLGKYGCRELIEEPDIIAGLKRIRDGSGLGKQITRVINRGLIRRVLQGVKQHDPRSVFGFSKTHLSLRFG